MKKLFFLCCMCLMALTMSAQRIAVLEFKAGVGISQNDVDGLSGIFTTSFRPSGYSVIERSQVDKIISEQGFQRSKLTEAQMVKVGKLLNLSCIVIGDVNVVLGEYNVDVRVVNVESGVIIATDGASFKDSYRTMMQDLASRLAKKIAVEAAQSGEWVDLGLPSGTLWKRNPESKNGELKFSYSEACELFGENNLPTMAQWEELENVCKYKWSDDVMGYVFTGPNGNSLIIYNEQYGIWSRTEYNSSRCYVMDKNPYAGGFDLYSQDREYHFHVRLVKNK